MLAQGNSIDGGVHEVLLPTISFIQAAKIPLQLKNKNKTKETKKKKQKKKKDEEGTKNGLTTSKWSHIIYVDVLERH